MTTPSLRQRANVLTIAPGVPFLPAFARALFEGHVVPGLSAASGPFALARATIYVPTQRARRALVSALADAAQGATLLPRIAALGALDDDEAGGADDPGIGDDSAVPPAIGPLARRLLLTDLVLAWARALPGAIVSADAQGVASDGTRPLLVGTSPADAFALAGELGRVIDEFIIEGIDPRRLGALADAEHDRYWQITTRFLEIAFDVWPKLLGERGAIDAAERRVRLAAIETERLTGGGKADPVIVLGSTGTNDATARLMAAICRLPAGAVVLPGLDTHLPDAVFAAIGQSGDDAEEPASGHPQAALKRLLVILGVKREDVTELAPDGMTVRARLLSEALRPAETTNDWPRVRAGFGASLPTTFDGVDLVEAADEREEALAIAIRLHKVAETDGQTAALVTPDRTLARRVRSELERWDIVIDDSAGNSLAASDSGSFARLVLAAVDEDNDATRLALLSHTRAVFGQDRTAIARLAQSLEIGLFRAGPVSHRPLAARIQDARADAKARGGHPAARRIKDETWGAMIALAGDLEAALAPLEAIARGAALSTWIEAHRAAIERIGGPPETETDERLAALFDDPALSRSALRLDASEYRAMFDRLASEQPAPAPRQTHPRLKILGLLEARLLSADVVILGGLDETIWPPVARTDAFLNRPMRAALGMSPPERRIGQTAHDFWMACGATEIVLTRARKRGGSPTTPSRFLQRIGALAGDALDPAKMRGDELLQFARRLDTPDEMTPSRAPTPRPPIALRPERLSVTRIEKWIRDPYSIYAEQILRLYPLDALDQPPGFAEQGTAIHGAIDWATKRFGTGPLPPDALQDLVTEADRLLAAMHEDPSWRAFRRPRQMAGLAYFLAYHRDRQPVLDTLFAEIRGEWPLTLGDGSTFTLTGEADRIEIDRAGAIRILDFKTGSPPSNAEIDANLAPQLTLEAAMVEAGAFRGVPSRRVAEAFYMKLGSRQGGETRPVAFKGHSLHDVVERHAALLRDLVEKFRQVGQAYNSRPIAKHALRYADYDHLARVKEWSATSGLGDET